MIFFLMLNNIFFSERQTKTFQFVILANNYCNFVSLSEVPSTFKNTLDR